jgi:hypothetical protein
LGACKQPSARLEKVTLLSDYPSGSSLAFLNDEIYLMGDDATSLMILNKDLAVKDSVQMLANAGSRMDKASKPDLEAMTVVSFEKIPLVLMIGSGSTDSSRSRAWLYGRDGKQKIDLSRFYQRLKEAGTKELNIEGLTAYQGGMILANRGNNSYRKNLLIFTTKDFFVRQDSADIKITAVGVNTDSTVFNGISGAGYAEKSDKLLLTVSTEDTKDSYADGSIGKSYLWIINDISRKKFTHINPDRIIDLGEIDGRFKGHKIESVCIVAETRKDLELVLVADDDNGKTLLFKLLLKK